MNKNDKEALLLMWQGYSHYAYAWRFIYRVFTVFFRHACLTYLYWF